MTVPVLYFSVGTTLANMANVELTVSKPPTYAAGGRLPLVGSVMRELGSGRHRMDGALEGSIAFDLVSRAEYRALLRLLLGGLTTGSAERYFSWLDDTGYYSAFKGWIDRPTGYRDFTPDDQQNVVFPLHDYHLQTVRKTSHYTITTSDRHVVFDTSGGNCTASLAALSGFTPYTIYSVVKEDPTSVNSLTIDPNGSELIDGGSTLVVAERADIMTDGSAWYTVVDGG